MYRSIASAPMLAAGLSLLVLASPAAFAAAPCHPLPNGFEFCAAGSDWEDAESFAFDDAVVLESDMLWLEIMPLPEEFAGQSLDAMLDSIATEAAQDAASEGVPAPDMLGRDQFQTATLNAVTMTMTESDDGFEYVVVMAVAESNDRHLVLALDGDETISAPEMEENMRNIAELIRPTEEG
ncbi:hypothetical protein [Roseinatronobacter monicus]|uniref:PsbP protein n=1 Tax=Roseinatronobacter monicus TaxID=393481 RepID=A0A543KD08_9RHOB|nr:hypothetical protein [Roseinatronobacter monicus]TQM92914.1 hypothetical protein BD293_1536 [Roseinatronobacter monicus]